MNTPFTFWALILSIEIDEREWAKKLKYSMLAALIYFCPAMKKISLRRKCLPHI